MPQQKATKLRLDPNRILSHHESLGSRYFIGKRVATQRRKRGACFFFFLDQFLHVLGRLDGDIEICGG